MTATEILKNIPDWIELVSVIMLTVCIAATVLVRVGLYIAHLTTFTDADDKFFGKAASVVGTINGYAMKILSYLPTIGLNPVTKRYKARVAELETEKMALESALVYETATPAPATPAVGGAASDAPKAS